MNIQKVQQRATFLIQFGTVLLRTQTNFRLNAALQVRFLDTYGNHVYATLKEPVVPPETVRPVPHRPIWER